LIEVHVASLAGTHAIAAAIANLSRPGDIIVLAGEMGSGKTAFAQGFGRALGITEPITSPTFTLVHSYDTGSITLHHADLYRLDQLSEVADLSLDELAETAVVLVEWGDVAESLFVEHLEVRLETDLDDVERRDILLSASGSSWAARWERLRGAVTSC
jgi:tRNA threonylcarbamoyladenosine biosynthesis protein TsaE